MAQTQAVQTKSAAADVKQRPPIQSVWEDFSFDSFGKLRRYFLHSTEKHERSKGICKKSFPRHGKVCLSMPGVLVLNINSL